MTFSSNEGYWEHASAGFAKETTSAAENRLAESVQFALSDRTFQSENERKTQATAKLLPDLQLGDFAKGSADSSTAINADNPLERPGYQPNDKPKFDAKDRIGSKFMPAEKSPTATIYFFDGSNTTVPMPPAKPGQSVDFYMPRQPEGGFVLTATAGDKAWILRKNEWKEWRK